MIKLFGLVLWALSGQGVLTSLTLNLLPSSSALAEGLPQTIVSRLAGSVILETKTAILPHGKKGEAYPYYKEAIIRYPVVTGLKDPTVRQNVQTAISLKRVVGHTIAEMDEEYGGWLSEIGYIVNYNQHNVLDLTYSIAGVGAYPSTFEKRVSVNLLTGKVLRAGDLFKADALGAIAQVVNQMMQKEMQKKIAEFRNEDPTLASANFADHRFQVKNLDNFSIGKEGVTFHYNFEFPHAIKAAEPSGAYLLSYDQLIRYIRKDGALGFHLDRNKSKS